MSTRVGFAAKDEIKRLAPRPKAPEETVTVTINNVNHDVPKEYTILDACRSVGDFVPTCCHHARLKPLGRCGVCVVEADGNLAYSCCAKVSEGQVITTNSGIVRAKQASALRAMKDRQTVRQTPKLEDQNEFDAVMNWCNDNILESNGAIRIDPTLCVDCSRCATACSSLQDMGILEVHPKDGVRPVGAIDLNDTACISCGQCTSFCPSGAIAEESHIDRILQAKRQGKILVAQTAPAVRVALDELFDVSGSEETPKARTGRMVHALRKLGVDYVFDSQFTADLTIMEEASELIERVTKKLGGDDSVTLPMVTSCCPAWVNAVELKYPDLIPHLSSCKSPMMMLGALIKNYFAPQVLKVDPSNVFSFAVMPCTAKKGEAARDNNATTEAVLTTRELAQLIKMQNVDYKSLSFSEFDNVLGESTGAAAIFGNSGGVMEAALRTAYFMLSGKELDKVELHAVRGFEGLREATIPVPLKAGGNLDVRVAICSGIKYAQQFITSPDWKDRFDFFEVMACQGGCICGGGQPHSLNPSIVQERCERLYDVDVDKTVRKSHHNVSVQKLYENFLEAPLSHKSHELLHTHYADRSWQVQKIGDEQDDDEEEVQDGDVNVSIVYATQTGNSKNFAQTMADEIKTRGGAAKIVQADKISVDDLASKSLLVFINSTFGQGEHNDMASPLWDSLQNASSGLLSNTKFAVFGLGSSAYPLFCKSSELFDQKFEELGGERITVMGKGDEKSDAGLFGGFSDFTEKLYEELGLAGDTVPTIPAPKYNVVLAPQSARGIPAAGYKYAKLKTNTVITPSHNKRLCRLIELDLTYTGLEYKTGWHVSILPRSSDADVEAFITEILGLDPKTVILVTPSSDSPVVPGLEHPVTLFEAFSQYIDISGRVNKNFLKALIPFADNKEQFDKLMYLTSKEGSDQFTTEYIKECKTYFEVLREFDSCRPNVGHLIAMIPPVKPRLYSIASSHKMHPGTIQLLIGKVFWETPKGVTRYGMTTLWLDHAQVGSKIAISVHSSPLTPPEDLSKPILMASMGSGFAPFRGFLQDREIEHNVNNNETGKMILFFGCRRPDEDWICEDEMKQWENSGLAEFSYAFSRVSAKKVYITHKVAERLEDLWQLLGVEGGGLYYCGGIGPDAQLRNSVKKSFIEVGGLTEEEADARIAKMEQDGLMVLEAW
ncbi:hypothetical protein P9112_011474 [Eukaryota sp. TZLM1-RC]